MGWYYNIARYQNIARDPNIKRPFLIKMHNYYNCDILSGDYSTIMSNIEPMIAVDLCAKATDSSLVFWLSYYE